MEWHSLTGHLPALIAVLTALAALLGAARRWGLGPRRMIGWLAAVKERETLLAMWEQEKQWRNYWEIQARACWDRLQDTHQ